MSSANPITSISGQSAANQYGYVDPYGTTSALYSSIYGANSPLSGGALGLYNANADSIINQISGNTGALATTLNQTAARQANQALDSAASNFANMGALNSGAAANAFGEAIASPFANAQAQLQNQQLSAGSNALQSLLGLSGSNYATGLGAASGLMENTSGLVAPQYMTNPQYASQQQGKQSVTGALTGGLGTALGIGGGSALAKLLTS